MSLFVIIIIGDLTQVPVLPLQWPVVVLVFLNRKIACIDPNSWSRVWRSWAVKAIIITFYSITFIISRVLPRLIQGLNVLETLKRLESKLLKLRKVLIKNLFLSAFVRLKERLMAPRTASIYFSDLKRKVESSFGFCDNGLFNRLFLDILSMAILLSLGTDKKP